MNIGGARGNRLFLLAVTWLIVCHSNLNSYVDAHSHESSFSSSSPCEDQSTKITSLMRRGFEGASTWDTRAFSYFGQIANFGNQMNDATMKYSVDLYLPPDRIDPYLCDDDHSFAKQQQEEDSSSSKMHGSSSSHDHESPMVLLVKRGNCSFETKARNALYIHQHVSTRVQYIFVYNNDKYYPKEIFSMSAEEEDTDMTYLDTSSSKSGHQEDDDRNQKLEELKSIGLIFISTDTGSTLLDIIQHESKASNVSPYLAEPTNDEWRMPTHIETCAGYSPTQSSQRDGQDRSWAERVYFFVFILLSTFASIALLSFGCCRLYQWNRQWDRAMFEITDTNTASGSVGDRHIIDDVEYGLNDQERRQKRFDFIKLHLKTKVLVLMDNDDDDDDPSLSSATTKDNSSMEEGVDREGLGSPSYVDTDEDNDDNRGHDNNKDDDDDDVVVYEKEDIITTTTRTKERDVCTICLREYKNGDILGHSLHPKCNHEFHEKCITHWLLKHEDCPLCRNIWSVNNTQNESDNHGDDDDNIGNGSG